MNTDIAVPRIGAGAAAGLVGTALIQGLMAASQKWAPQSLPPVKQDPGEFMVKKAEEQLPDETHKQIPEQLEKVAAKTLAFGYGMAFGGLYATSRPQTKSLLLEGSALGLAAWGVGYLGWLPATGLMPSVTKQERWQIAGPIVSHILFGIVTVGIYRLLRRIS
jgi:hypothetical protein